jgi:hypothetical protein
MFGIRGELRGSIIRRDVVPIWERNIGPYMSVFDGLMFSIVPYVVSPVICLGRSRQRKKTCQSKSSMG